jgi:putative ATP-dependent endonuclease of OLD family
MKSLIIGGNDVGKTNLLYALRILFDKDMSARDFELTGSDYNAYSNCNEIEITVSISRITEDCLLSTFKGGIKSGCTLIRYTKKRDGSYKFFNGFDSDVLVEIPGRIYIKRLHLEFIDSTRDLFRFLQRERNHLLELAKEIRVPEATLEDNAKLSEIQDKLSAINGDIENLHFVKDALSSVNTELNQLSIHNEDQIVHYTAGNNDANKLLEQLDLSYSTGTSPLIIGGDGRNNQIVLATWISQKKMSASVDHVSMIAIEEPEAHLHPHQQRKLAKYIVEKLEGQVFITTHSPHIASEFIPGDIVRLYERHKISHAAQEGCSEVIKKSFDDFGYRLDSLSSEVFFSDGVFLVEGISEKLFYTRLALQLGFEFDRLNITIWPVEGVGFCPYINICQALDIPFVLRTDNDIFLRPRSTTQYFAGLQRAYKIYRDYLATTGDPLIRYWDDNKEYFEWEYPGPPPDNSVKFSNEVSNMLREFYLYLADTDLETDLVESQLYENLTIFYGESDKQTLVKKMQERKAENILKFLHSNSCNLMSLKDTKISDPIYKLFELVSMKVHPNE